MYKYYIRPLPIFKTIYPCKSLLTYLLNGKETQGTNHMFYIEGAKRNILIDATPSAQDLRGLQPPGFSLEHLKSPEEALAEIGLKPRDIDILILTHLHQDHVLNITKFTNAEIYIQEDEYAFARAPHPFWSLAYLGINMNYLSKTKLRLIRGEYEIEESIKLIPTPGHTPGTQSVLIETPAGKAIIAGFCTIRENFEPPEKMRAQGVEVIPPGILMDFEKAYESALRVKRMADIVIPCHENSLPKIIP